MSTPKPVALTCGEPAGVGPELTVKAWRALGQDVPFFMIGERGHLPADAPVSLIDDPSQAYAAAAHGVPLLHHDFSAPVRPGQPRAENAQDVINVIKRAHDLVMKGAASAICTNPINKKVLQDGAGFSHPGHTEYLAALAGVDHVVMMLACDTLRVVPTTIHISLSDVPGALTPDLLESTIRITHRAMQTSFGVPNPTIAIAGLNPHAGEGGAMGTDEIDMITPLLERLRGEGMTLLGPMSADTMFHARARAGYDAAIAMYHDQALIPIKTLAFDEGVNVTLGLPFVRTSPDHGTAFDIAGQGIANPGSLIAALKMAQRLAG